VFNRLGEKDRTGHGLVATLEMSLWKRQAQMLAGSEKLHKDGVPTYKTTVTLIYND